MVELRTPQAQATVRQAGQVGSGGSAALIRAGRAAQGSANTFTEFYEGKAAIENDLLLAQAQSDWSTSYAERSRSAGNGFAEGMMTDYDAYVAEVMGRDGTPQRGRDNLQAAFAEYRIGLEGKVQQREAAARAAASSAAAADAQRLRANAIVLDNSLMEESIEGATSEQERSLYLRTGLTARMADDPQGVIDSVETGQWNAVLTPSQTQSFMTLGANGVERIQRDVEAERVVEQRELVTALEEEINYVALNGALPADSQMSDDNIAATFEGNPEGAEEMRRVRDNAVMDAENINAVTYAPPDVIVETLNELRAAIAEPGHSAEDAARLSSYANALTDRNQRLAEDSAGYVAQNNEVVEASFGIYQNSEDPETQFVAARNYVNELDVRYDVLGVPDENRSILPSAAASSYVQSFNEMGSDIAGASLRSFRDSWGESAPRVMAELRAAGLAPEYFNGMRYDDPVLSESIINLAGVTDTQIKSTMATADISEVNKELPELFREYAETFTAGSGGSDAIGMMDDNYSIMERLTLQRVIGGASPATAAQDVFDQMFPEEIVNANPSTASRDYPRSNIIVPQGVDTRALDNIMGMVFIEENLRSLMPFQGSGLPDAEAMDLQVEQMRENGIWLNNSTGDGVALMVNSGGAYIRVLNIEGNPVELKFDMLVPNE